jgi:hypothetical protein
MPDVDDELVARTLRWCAEAGRVTGPDEVRAALGGLSWDELLAARALLADAPPARPLGPYALADLARGAPPETVSERERSGAYGGAGGATPPPSPAPPSRSRAPRAQRRVRAAEPVIRRARDRVEPPERPAPCLPPLDDLARSEGRATLERLVREHGANRSRLAAALANGWRRGDGTPPVEADLEPLLALHGLARGFERRERDELLHALRAAAGVKRAAAAAAALAPEAYDAALARLGAVGDAEAIRASHRGELRRRATLSERARALLTERDRLEDLDLLAEFEADLRQRLPHHLRAVRASHDVPLRAALARSLSIGPRDVDALVARLGIDLGEGATAPPAPRTGERDRGRPGAPGRPARGAGTGGAPPHPARPRSRHPREPRPHPRGGGKRSR